MTAEDPFKQVIAEAAESVAMGNGNFFDHSLESEFQKGLKSFPLEVESGSNVGDDEVVGEAFLHEGNLPLQVVALTCGGHSAVTVSADDIVEVSRGWAQ